MQDQENEQRLKDLRDQRERDEIQSRQQLFIEAARGTLILGRTKRVVGVEGSRFSSTVVRIRPR